MCIRDRRYPWNVDGSMVLVTQSYSEDARHESALGSSSFGPNVFHRNVAVRTLSDSGPHHRYAVGALFDSVETGAFSAENRKWAGTGQGWAGATIIFWNVVGTKMSVQSPPGSKNYVIGGKFTESKYDLTETDLLHQIVTPQSLYEAQLKTRREKQCMLKCLNGPRFQ